MSEIPDNPEKMSILIAEDHDMFGDGLAFIMREVLPDVTIHRAADFHTACRLLEIHPEISFACLDIQMPGVKGLEGIKAIKQMKPIMAIVVISVLDFSTNIRNVMDIGVNGFISKDTDRGKLKRAITQILDGQIVVEANQDGADAIFLSPRQQQVLLLIGEGKTNKEIADKLHISLHTAKEHVSNVIRVLNADNRTHAFQIAERTGLLFDEVCK